MLSTMNPFGSSTRHSKRPKEKSSRERSGREGSSLARASTLSTTEQNEEDYKVSLQVSVAFASSQGLSGRVEKSIMIIVRLIVNGFINMCRNWPQKRMLA
jgi:hypothetical protein